MNGLLIYVPRITPRIKYVFGLVFNELCKIDYSFTTDNHEFINTHAPKINYSIERFGNEFFIESGGLLNENFIRPQNVSVTDFQGTKIFYQCSPGSDLSFDIFCAAFYMVSRYEEYLPFGPDIHGRFEASRSLAFLNGFLEEPVVNQWVNILIIELQKKYPSLVFHRPIFSFLPTIDVDSVFAYREKGILRTALASLNDLIHFNLTGLKKRWLVLMGIEPDPFDAFGYLAQVHETIKVRPVYFFLCGTYSKYDKNVPCVNKEFRRIVRQVLANFDVGIHPSYYSNRSLETLRKEKDALSEIMGKPVKRSRQHFLLLRFPQTYQNLISVGIEEDYSMGFASACGFRAGICSPFYFYDLENEEITNLRVVPITFMDATLKRYMKLAPNEAIAKIIELINKTRQVGGVFISLWHNESLSEYRYWKGWRRVFEEMNRNLQ